MKRYIKSSVENTLTYEIDVLCNVTIYNSSEIYSVLCSEPTKIAPIKYDKVVDQQALANYHAFVDNIYACLCEYFDVVDYNLSNKSDTSYYFWLYAKNKDNDVATKFIIRLRLSDHEYPPNHSDTAEKRYTEREAQNYKRPENKKYQKWKIYSIIVNNQTYSTYEAAEDAIYEEMEEFSRKMYNK